MTKAQIEAWLAGWREVEALQEGEACPDRATCLSQTLPLCDLLRSLAKSDVPTPSVDDGVRETWVRLRSTLSHG